MSTKNDSECLAKAGEAEPIFVLRSTDQLAPIVVRFWARLAKKAGTPTAKVQKAFATTDEMDAWQQTHGAKRPD